MPLYKNFTYIICYLSLNSWIKKLVQSSNATCILISKSYKKKSTYSETVIEKWLENVNGANLL